ncbi:hypothetical protein BST61_g3368 [Cercospora zeina]
MVELRSDQEQREDKDIAFLHYFDHHHTLHCPASMFWISKAVPEALSPLRTFSAAERSWKARVPKLAATVWRTLPFRLPCRQYMSKNTNNGTLKAFGEGERVVVVEN